jgi:hypothetical protein
MTTANKDTEILASEAEPLTLSSGVRVNVERLKTRQTMSLLKIITRGAGAAMADLSFDESTTTADFTGKLLGAIVMSIPEAEDETMEFLGKMTSPVGLIEGARSAPEKEINSGLYEALAKEMYNPELEDLVAIVEVIVTNEAPHMLALGKRLALLLKVQKKSETAKRKTSSKKSSTN